MRGTKVRLTVKPLFSPTLTAGAERESISHRPFWAVVVTPCNVYKPTVARGDKGPRCVMRAVGCLPDGSGPWVTANLNGGAAGLAAPRPLTDLLGPFCGWIKEAHVGRLQCGGLAHRAGMPWFSLFFVFFVVHERKKEREREREIQRETQSVWASLTSF